ncbi:ABC transporter permease [Microbacterium allomyrinae]|uniref:ABC transporter permease n=1 Tax=Microbacterium allomyrinae TaxID=2830666 RepID=A0A9X1S231_9MICO|nr:ABC transporter permease [Microbacterium allomyrinae]MCC2031559.1 ABC transporter permease [Microbacterium allomyrinae]
MRYVLGRIAQAAIVLLIAFTAAYTLLQALPGDALLIKFENPEAGLSPAEIALLRDTLGADVPALTQYFDVLGGFLVGNFGHSIQSGTPVREVLATALPETLVLAAAGFVSAVVLAVALAGLSQFRRLTWLRNALRSLPSLFVSIPVFWLGIVLIQVFSFRLGWVPVVNPGPIQGLILPVIALALPIAAPIAQILIRSIDDVTLQPFITVVRAKGATEGWILTRNVARNAVLPALTIAGLLFGELIGGAVITETVFGRTGIGRVTEQAVTNQDTPVLLAVVIVSAAVFVLVNLIVDLVYPLLDPRLSPTAKARS